MKLICMLLAILLIGVMTAGWIAVGKGLQELRDHDEECWFLSERARTVMVEDLVKWAKFAEHAEDVTMEEYYAVRVPEMLEMWSTLGLTEIDALDCLHSLEMSND